MQTIKDVVHPGWTAVDVGAHIGYSTLLLAQCVGPAGKVIAFEPLAENFKMLQENVQLNGHSTVITENLALMDRSGRIELRSATPGAMTWVASANIDSTSAVESQTVEVIPFDSYAQQRNINKVDFIKMDVEGAEAAVLGGMNDILKRDKPTLLIEIHGYLQLGECHPALMKLKEQNYTVTNLGKRNWEIHVLAQAAS